MALKRKDNGRAFSPARKALSRSGLGMCRSPRRGLSTSFQASSKPIPTARPGARPATRLGSAAKGSSANMKVVVRVRPLNQRESESNARVIVDVVDEKMIVFDPKREEESFFFHGAKQKGRDMLKKQNKHTQYLFDRVFGVEASNEEVFEGSTKSVVSSVLDGFNCSVFVYGATGAGKTFTMLGTQENPGITFRTMVHLFEQIDAQQHEKSFEIGVSYLEVYNEAVKDLLNPSAAPLHLREDVGGVMVAGLKIEMISDPHRMFELLAFGNKNRSQHPTDANAESSRSHAVFQVFVKMKTKLNGQTKMVKLSMIDLAGSERGAATGCAGARFKEGSNINKSLLALGNCINALADGQRHIPYRDSKLTRLLKDSLGGNCQTVMIANVAPAHHTYEDTHNTLKYATRAKSIKFQIKRNIVSVELHVSHYIKMVEDMKAEIERLNTDKQVEMQSLQSENEALKKEVETLRSKCQTEVATVSETEPSHLPPLVAAAVAAINCKSKPAVELSTVAVNTSPCKELSQHSEEFKRLVEEAEKLYFEKARIHNRYLTMDSTDKVLQWRIKMKQRTIDRVLSMSSTPSRMDKAQTKVNKSVEQFLGRLMSAKECQDSVSDEEKQINLRLEEIRESMKKFGVFEDVAPYLNAFELQLLNQELNVKCLHLEKLVDYLDKGFERHDEMLKNVSALFRKYYNLVRGHGHMNEELKSEHEAVMRGLEGLKNVQWENGGPQVFQSPVDSGMGAFKRPLSPKQNVALVETDSNARRTENSMTLDSQTPVSCGQSMVKEAILQSPLCSSSSNPPVISKNMDTATMLNSLQSLDSKVDGILNTSFSSVTVEVGCAIEDDPVLGGKRRDLNSTYNAETESDLNSTFTKDDPADVPINLNETFEKPRDGDEVLPHISSATLNGTFSLDSEERVKESQTSENPISVPSLEEKNRLSPVKKLGLPSSLSPLSIPSAIRQSLSPARTSPTISAVGRVNSSPGQALPSSIGVLRKPSPIGVNKKSAAVSSTSPSVSSVKRPGNPSPTVFAVPSCVPPKPVGGLRRPFSSTVGDKRKALSSNLLPIKPTSSKIGINRKIVVSNSKLHLNTPSKVKLAWNKENRSTHTKAVLPISAKKGGNSKPTTKSATPVPLNDTFTKASPK